MKETFFKKIDEWHLELLGILVIAVILSPILYLCVRDGNGSAIFQMHDQFDETILNYVFTAKYFGADIYDQMMCGVPAEALKPFCILFLPLYKIFSVYTAFLLQYIIVVITAFYGMYFCVKKLTGSSVASLIAATVFSFLPVHSVYGNVVMGTPLLIYSVLNVRENSKKSNIIGVIGIIFYGLSTSLVLSGWFALAVLFFAFVAVSIANKKVDRGILISFGILLIIYVACNVDLLINLVSSNRFVSHRVEYALSNDGVPFMESFVGIMTKGNYVFEAESKHIFIIFPIAVALILLVCVKRIRKNDKYHYVKNYIMLISSVMGLAFLYAFLGTGIVVRIKQKLPGMLSSFNITRVYYFLPGIMYILFGVSCAIIIKSLSDKLSILAYMLTIALSTPSLLYIVKDHNGIFYQNINQINNGQSITGYITMKNLYSEELMTSIEESIGKEKSSYRVVNIGISPVVALMNGFYTIDGYSNNYSLEYKHQFREVIADELELNEYVKAYFDLWGNRCYVFYHEWGDAYMIGKNFSGQISDLHLNMNKLKEMNCQYIFSSAEIVECKQYGLEYLGDFSDNISYWHIWVYKVN